MSYTNIFGGNVIGSAFPSFAFINLTQDKTLSWPTQFQNVNEVVANIMDVFPSQGGLSLTLPDASKVSVGQSIYINNLGGEEGSFSFTLKRADGTTLTVVNSPAGDTNDSFVFMYLVNNTSVGGVWRITPFGGGATGVTSVGAESTSDNLVIEDQPIVSAGIIKFSLAKNLLNLSSLAPSPPNGIVVLSSENTFTLTSLTGENNQIALTNPGGIGGQPKIALAPNITGVTSLTSGNLKISGNTLEAMDANGSVILKPNGTGSVHAITKLSIYNASNSAHFNSFVSPAGLLENIELELPSTPPSSGQVMAAISGASPYKLGWAVVPTVSGGVTVDAIPRFSNVGGGLKESHIYIDDSDNISLGTFVSPPGVTNSITLGDSQQLQLGVVDGNTISATVGPLKLQPQTTESVEIGSPSVGQEANIKLYRGKGVYFRDSTETYQVGLFAANATSSYDLNLPVQLGTAGTFIYNTNGSGQLGVTSAPVTISGVSKGYGYVTAAGALDPVNKHNIASVSHPATGQYQVTFTVPMANNNYVANCTIGGAGAPGSSRGSLWYITDMLVTGFKVNITDNAAVPADKDADFSFVCLAA